MVTENPFTSETFVTSWSGHFIQNEKTHRFGFIDGVSFFKSHKKLAIYTNVGKNLTKGLSYRLNPFEDPRHYGKKTLLIYDIPEYFNVTIENLPTSLRLIKIRQYKGFIAKLDAYKNFDDYFQKTFSKKSRYKFKSYQRNLENCFDVKYVNYFGQISKEEYDVVFNAFHAMLKRRFDEKSEANNNLEDEEWNFYYDTAYKLILEKKASLYVIYDGKKPIAISLNYLSKDILFFAMTSFDVDYFKFNVGKVHLMELFKWCFENNMKTFDFSKGYYDYKERWGNEQYHFEYHILYDPKSITSVIAAKAMAMVFKFKQHLRDRELTQKINRLKRFLKPEKEAVKEKVVKEIELETLDGLEKNMEEIKLDDSLSYLRRHVYDFLYLSNLHIKNLKLYKLKNDVKNTFILKGTEQFKVLEVTES
ncbi:GNAT family N-acetyltransferase [Flavobacteriaceae bacterium SZ-1-7]|uniref:GNAT family N-acetyltransferase n=1 Tax=Tamlana sedimenti TaxID=3134126 RepID=UPI003121E860